MKALIIDDEPMPAKHLREMIKQYCFEVSETEIIQSPKQALEHLEENAYDLIFLDVEMPEMDGMEFLSLVKLPKETAVIFTTAYSEYAVDAFKANATHYIMKPVEEKELILSVRKAINQKQSNSNANSSREKSISVFDGEEYTIVKTNDIIRLEADGSYTKFLMEGKEILASKRIGFYEVKLPKEQFIRCHNSHVINLSKVSKIGKSKSGYLVMSNNDIVPISPSKKAMLEKAMGL